MQQIPQFLGSMIDVLCGRSPDMSNPDRFLSRKQCLPVRNDQRNKAHFTKRPCTRERYHLNENGLAIDSAREHGLVRRAEPRNCRKLKLG